VTTVAVIAHKEKTFGGGLSELRSVLAKKGFADPLWYEVSKSRQAPDRVRQALAEGANLLFVWGGDGTVQRCVDAAAGTAANLAILPAGTANLFAKNLHLPTDVSTAVEVGLCGERRRLDVGVLNGERFAVMAGVGFDALMMRDADSGVKARFGRIAYVWSGIRATRVASTNVRIVVDGKRFFKGNATCVLLGQMGSLGVGVVAFPDALPDDGLLEIGVVTATTVPQWTRVLSRLVLRDAKRSPFIQTGRGSHVEIKMKRSTRYELDGGARKAKKKFHASVEPLAISVCVPKEASE
jgi:diacylglycerol kinase (ATP)